MIAYLNAKATICKVTKKGSYKIALVTEDADMIIAYAKPNDINDSKITNMMNEFTLLKVNLFAKNDDIVCMILEGGDN